MCSKNGIKDARYKYIARQCVQMVVLSNTTPVFQGRNPHCFPQASTKEARANCHAFSNELYI